MPPGATHGDRAGPAGGHLLIVYLPAGLEELFRKLGTVTQDATSERREAIARKYDTEWLEPDEI